MLEIPIRGWSLHFDHLFLRDSCSCEQCVDPSTKQRGFQTAHIPLNIRAREVLTNDDTVTIWWENDIPGYDKSHCTRFEKETLIHMRLWMQPRRVGRTRRPWNRGQITENITRISWNDYLNDPEQFARCMAGLHEHGLIFLYDVPESSEAVQTIAERIGPLRNSLYGLTWDVKSVANAINAAYTHQNLGFHMDLLYMADPPGYQLLHCLHNSCQGGESRFVDAFAVAEKMRKTQPEIFQTLTTFPVTYAYHNGDQHYQYTRPTFELSMDNLLDRDLKLDKVPIAYVNWSPPFQGNFIFAQGAGKGNDRVGNRLRAYVEAAKEFSQQLEAEDLVYEMKLNPGECVIFENRRVCHARRGFELGTGERWLRGAYVDEDAFLSKASSLFHTGAWSNYKAEARQDKHGFSGDDE